MRQMAGNNASRNLIREKHMANENKPNPQPSKIKLLDLSKAEIRKRLEDTAKVIQDKEKLPSKPSFHAGSVLKLAFIRIAADALELQGPDRAKFIGLLDATPGWFGCGNNSACRQDYEKKGSVGDIEKDYGAY